MILRDGAKVSLWQANADPYLTNSTLDHDKKYDAIIVGGGITGVTTALLLQQSGLHCALIEAYHLGFGTTSGTTAHLNTLLDTPYPKLIQNFGKENAQRIAQLTGDAIGLVKSHVNQYGIDCGFKDQDAYLFACDDKQSKEQSDIYRACQDLGLAVSHTASIPIPTSFLTALCISDQATFRPLDYVYALAQAFEAAGGVIIQECRVVNSEEQKDQVTVQTTKGNASASTLIYCTHIPPGINVLHFRCTAYRSYAMAVKLRNGNYPDHLSYDMDDPYHYYRTQRVNDSDYLIVGGEDHQTGHARDTNKCFRQLESHLMKIYPSMEIVHQWSSQYFEPADGLPYIGKLPGSNGKILVATGFGGNGMVYSHVAANLLKELVHGENNEDIHLFSPTRLKPIAGFYSVVSHNTDVLGQYVRKLIPAEKLESVTEISHDEGKVVYFENQTIGLYKDEEGKLIAVSPDCKHAKCTVSWNTAEKSWDCPCHGARYSAEGEVLNGPTTHPLDKIDVYDIKEENSFIALPAD
jgi:glycine/D-amino acid oxidase-like deaminating enzyme/nitrite reductase/ring-hydroxylating ferredoxin subunit